MTHCNRCGEDFDNFFNGVHWCTNCGKQFAIDINMLKKETES
ncbi:transposase [Candidatus Woesearchaeota archaeon]|nr:MAG: transposase [Candidatus Woesearchaeota archaeon]